MMYKFKMEKKMETKILQLRRKTLLIPLILGILVCINSILAIEPYYNASVHGLGIEGFINYANNLVDGWFVNAFLAFIWLVVFFGFSKTEKYMESSCAAYAFLTTFILSIIFALFTTVGSYVIFISVIGLAISIFLNVARSRG